MNEIPTTPRVMPEGWTLPEITDENRAFFTSGELRVQRCTTCHTVQHPPDEVCHSCQSMEFDYVQARPSGVIESFSIVHHAVHPMLSSVVPYNVVVVALDEYPSVHLVGNVTNAAPAEIEIGLPVVASWAEIPADENCAKTRFLPQWSVVQVT